MNPLDRGQLRALVQELAAQPDMWLHLVRHEPDQRVYELLRHDAGVMVWLICWMQDHDTGFHDHDISSGAVAVAGGQVREERLRLGPREPGGALRRFSVSYAEELRPLIEVPSTAAA